MSKKQTSFDLIQELAKYKIRIEEEDMVKAFEIFQNQGSDYVINLKKYDENFKYELLKNIYIAVKFYFDNERKDLMNYAVSFQDLALNLSFFSVLDKNILETYYKVHFGSQDKISIRQILEKTDNVQQIMELQSYYCEKLFGKYNHEAY